MSFAQYSLAIPHILTNYHCTMMSSAFHIFCQATQRVSACGYVHTQTFAVDDQLSAQAAVFPGPRCCSGSKLLQPRRCRLRRRCIAYLRARCHRVE